MTGPKRRNKPLFVTLPPPERQRLDDFAATVGRPLSWIVRDALRVYIDAVEADAARLAAPIVDATDAGQTPPMKQGRPPKDATKG